MVELSRFKENPLFIPDSLDEWRAYAVFNPSFVAWQNGYRVVYRALSKPRHFDGHNLRISSIGVAQSPDRRHFSQHRLLIEPEAPWERFGCEDPRACIIDGQGVIFYTAIGEYPFRPEGIRVAVALTDDFQNIRERHLVTPFNAKAMVLFPERIAGKLQALVTVNTDLPPATIALVSAERLSDFWDPLFWERWQMNLSSHALPVMRLNTDHVEVGTNPVLTPRGWLLFYAHIRNYGRKDALFGIEALVLDRADPRKIIARTINPLLSPREPYELNGTVPNVVFASSALMIGDRVELHYGAADTVVAGGSFGWAELDTTLLPTAPRISLKRLSHDPIIAPTWENTWERSATFNPAAVRICGLVHLLYRAQGYDGVSVLGYALSADGKHISYRGHTPAYVPRMPFELPRRPGGSGCEDPRLTVLDNTVYLLYTAYDGESPPRVAMSSISIVDFVHRNWQMWADPILISRPNEANKDACLFPDRIGGKYVFVHRVEPNMSLAFRDSLEFGPDEWLETDSIIPPRPHSWDDVKIGLNAPPIKTDRGWLLLYHGISSRDRAYRLGALLLALDNPRQVIGRSVDPILEPLLPWEQRGVVDNVVFPCGAVELDGELIVYYGGADHVIGVATCQLNELTDALLAMPAS